MTDRPLSVYDVFNPSPRGSQHVALGDHWYWCRKCNRPENNNWAMIGCIRVGPFMSTREASECGEGLRRADAVLTTHHAAVGRGVLSELLRAEAEASVALDKGDGQTFVVDGAYAVEEAEPEGAYTRKSRTDAEAWDIHQKCIERWSKLSDAARAGTTFHPWESHK